MSTPIPNRFLVSAGMAFFLVHSMQIGIGILGFQRYIAKDAGYDAWISILISSVSIHIVLWMMYSMLNKEEGDLISIHQRVFGKWFGGFLSTVAALYFLFLGVTVLRSFMEAIQVWMFPNLSMPFFLAVFLILIYYTISSGFRVVAGIAFFGVIIPSFLILFIFFPFQYGDWDYLRPVMNHSFMDLLKSAKVVTLEYIGFETILLMYPFIKHGKQSQKWAQLGVLFSTFIYVLTAIAAFVYFSEAQLERTIWATLSMFKIIEFPFVERFEYLAITTWVLVIFPNICISLWCSSRAIKRTYNCRQRWVLILVLVITYVVHLIFKDRESIDVFINTTSKTGFYALYVYIPLLFLLFHFKTRRRHRK
ncbi:GerAB/ArcD/ProY family transporter [Alkalihalobacillus sp. AL-G]|uniref:GerAB/ArcD/ProY family transporter n=1 Tax=Alkalihalobacillus sp. AL-G TaxID=2926399 RepID=UPI00272B7818|nr:GerAB/ArcD/ProY family transporter [Alkalihalobacillus sp. AL-G]WLD93638.1 spore germination protein [Alkalihalobacillus sp. AL-G]